MSLLEAISLGKEFKRRGQRSLAPLAAVDDVNLAVKPGDFITITGKSGSGKTTLLTLLAGLASPTSGRVLFRGRNLRELPDRELSRLRNREISFIPQGMGLLGNLTVRDNVRAPQLFAGKDGADSSRADFLLEAVGLSELAQEYPPSLSGGEMRRVAIARALFNQPALLIADEPTSDLDPANTRLVMELLRKANQQDTTVLMVTHEQEIALYGSVRLTMESGKLA
ncbi:MAG: ABC transporter ATP-binding protein [Deltaproteobacteria bacterium]|nr:ABC transporter ATP-binding protein [Deltaproteobacteria bacterium]